jgi:hypothetical protein
MDQFITFSIFLPAIAGILTGAFRKKILLPLVLCVCLGLLNETLISLIRSRGIREWFYLTANTYYLLESVCYAWFFFQSKVTDGKFSLGTQIVFLGCLFLLNACWYAPFSHFMVHAYNMVTVLFGICSVRLLAREALNIKQAVYDNPLFLAAMAVLLLSVISLFVECLRLLQLGTELKTRIYDIYRWVNPVAYLLFAYSFVCSRNKKIIS